MSSNKNCIFTGLKAEAIYLSGNECTHYRVQLKGQEFVYYIHNRLLDDLSSQFSRTPISSAVRTKIMNKIISLNDEKFSPYLLYDKNYNFNLKMRDEVLVPVEYQQQINAGIEHKNKEKNILKLLAQKLKDKSPFEYTGFHQFDLYRLKMNDQEELLTWLGSLESKKLIHIVLDLVGSQPFFEQLETVRILPLGWEAIHEFYINQKNKNVFIAMAFTDSEGKIYDPKVRETIKEACSMHDWTPLIVDEYEHNEGIVDKIMSLINDANFVIADLTHHKHGVYYEAGYAKALGIPVIHTVHEDHFDKVHFDLRHINLIKWKELSDLKEKLSNRISFTIKATNNS